MRDLTPYLHQSDVHSRRGSETHHIPLGLVNKETDSDPFVHKFPLTVSEPALHTGESGNGCCKVQVGAESGLNTRRYSELSCSNLSPLSKPNV